MIGLWANLQPSDKMMQRFREKKEGKDLVHHDAIIYI
jgi:hypothetical protein